YFLQKHGSPGTIASSWKPETLSGQHLPFVCNLCGLCTKICPPSVGLDPTAMFLEMRQQIVKSGAAPFPGHKRLLAYEGRGLSARYSCSVLPNHCDTVLFPGCGFAGTRPARLLELFEHLRQNIPSLGIVLSCCAKPSHDLGQQDFFLNIFGKLRQFLVTQGVQRVLVLCPSCHAIFKQYGFPLQTEYVYTLLTQHPLPKNYVLDDNKKITIHDPCITRQDDEVHHSVRQLIQAASLEREEMPHHGSKTLCCGEGGAVPFIEKKNCPKMG
ncbi:MAG: (Fe-S)-binding protein, partial [Candidatus Electrothrix sp. MAN1_4]|nr:(Fe-S)-binding protein [Candidatus Electrothrix sp. MAN1_4]